MSANPVRLLVTTTIVLAASAGGCGSAEESPGGSGGASGAPQQTAGANAGGGAGKPGSGGGAGSAGSSGGSAGSGGSGAGLTLRESCEAYCAHYLVVCDKRFDPCPQFCDSAEQNAPPACVEPYAAYYSCASTAELDCDKALGVTPDDACGYEQLGDCL